MTHVADPEVLERINLAQAVQQVAAFQLDKPQQHAIVEVTPDTDMFYPVCGKCSNVNVVVSVQPAASIDVAIAVLNVCLCC